MTDFKIESLPKDLYKEITELAKTKRKILLKKIKNETEEEQNKEKFLNPVKLIREHSER